MIVAGSRAGIRARGAMARPGWRQWWRWLALGLGEADQTETGARSAGPSSRASAVRSSGPPADDCEQFIRTHERAILNYLWRMTGDEQTAYDLTQEVFLRAWQHFPTIRAYDQPRGWLFRVATNLALSHLRRRSLLSGGFLSLDDEQSPAASDPAWRLVERDAVRQVLLCLSPNRRAALILREVYGLSGAEVGRVLGMNETTVRTTLHRAREQFRSLYLRANGEESAPDREAHHHA